MIIKGVGSEAVVTKPDVPVCKGVVHIVDTARTMPCSPPPYALRLIKCAGRQAWFGADGRAHAAATCASGWGVPRSAGRPAVRARAGARRPPQRQAGARARALLLAAASARHSQGRHKRAERMN